ncbi:MAG: fused MFS/spermidine synthase [Fimbriimonadaceae bacterium]|nr:fused MFS/spermidine synthase [Fimbriimonadaceae bacterium]
MALYAVTIFLSAFLLFQVQPLIGKYILPWFGGTPGVWTTCLLFFQLALLGGYAYAHLVVSRLRPRQQGGVHLGLLLLAAATMPIIPSEAWKPVDAANPVGRILGLLAATVGLPYLLLSTTGPLLQGWFARANSGQSPYRLYALSNIGSLLALLTYPVLFERYLRLPTQVWLWSGTYLLFVLSCGAVAIGLRRTALSEPLPDGTATAADSPRPTAGRLLLWLLLSGGGSLMLLAVTNHMCQDVAVVPFLWVAPLSLYLLSFILCFEYERFYDRRVWGLLLALSMVGLLQALLNRTALSLTTQIALYCGLTFTCCMVCHGELVKLKPAPRHLTLFYLLVSAGGALGGVAVALVAPRIFRGYWELHLGAWLISLLLAALAARDGWQRRRTTWPTLTPVGRANAALFGLVGLVGLWFLADGLLTNVRGSQLNSIAAVRNFYGTLQVLDEYRDDPLQRQHILCHGQTRHGYQFLDPTRQDWPTAYFGPQSGVGTAITRHPRRGQRPLRLGVIGLGAGTLAVYAQRQDSLVFYEINPLVNELTSRYFTTLHRARERGAEVVELIGDGRIVMEQQLARGEAQRFDVLVADAFSSDAIPTHLLTQECAALYWQHLQPDGILAMQCTNRYLDIAPVIRQLALQHGKEALYFNVPGDPASGTFNSRWVVATSNSAFLNDPEVRRRVTPWPDGAAPILWTDSFTNLYQVLLR